MNDEEFVTAMTYLNKIDLDPIERASLRAMFAAIGYLKEKFPDTRVRHLSYLEVFDTFTSGAPPVSADATRQLGE